MQPILRMADLSQPFILQVDASNNGLGAVLLQEEEGKKSPVAYASRKLKTSEKAYAVIEKKMSRFGLGNSEFSQVHLWYSFYGRN